jgi:hypothetical protein
MARIAVVLVTLLSMMLQPLCAAPARGPGSTFEAERAYTFFYAKLAEVPYPQGGRELKASEIAAQLAVSGDGAVFEAIRAYDFFYAKLAEVPYPQGGRVLAAIELALKIGTGGPAPVGQKSAARALNFTKLDR